MRFFLAFMDTGVFNSAIHIKQFSNEFPRKIARKKGCCTLLQKLLASAKKSLSLGKWLNVKGPFGRDLWLCFCMLFVYTL